MFVAKALEDTLRRVVLLTVNRSVLLQNTVDDIREGGQFRAFRWLASPISPAVPNAAASSSPSRAQCQTDLPPLAGADHQHGRPAERADIGPRCTSSRLPSQKKIEGYRWQSFTPPAAGKSRRFRGLICHRRSHTATRPRAITSRRSWTRYLGREPFGTILFGSGRLGGAKPRMRLFGLALLRMCFCFMHGRQQLSLIANTDQTTQHTLHPNSLTLTIVGDATDWTISQARRPDRT